MQDSNYLSTGLHDSDLLIVSPETISANLDQNKTGKSVDGEPSNSFNLICRAPLYLFARRQIGA